jgi:hypothetical protein
MSVLYADLPKLARSPSACLMAYGPLGRDKNALSNARSMCLHFRISKAVQAAGHRAGVVNCRRAKPWQQRP